MGVKGVIVAAGYGTRLLPITRVVPKELLPLVDEPCLSRVITEFEAAGVEEVLVVTSRRKRALEDWFDRDPELEAALAGQPARLQRAAPPCLRVSFVRQSRMQGTGDALLLAADFAGDDPVIVAFPDDLFEPADASAQLVAAWERTGTSVLLAADLAGQDVSAYGVLSVSPIGADLRVHGVIEKPARGTEPSSVISVGRYLYTPAFFEALRRHRAAHTGGEYYPMPAMNELASAGELHATLYQGERHDTGTTLGYARAFIDAALRREDIGPDLARWLASRS